VTRPKELVLPAFLLACLIIGGSSQAIWGNAFLQLFAAAILGWSVLTRQPQPLTLAGRRLLQIVAATGLLFLVQVIPLPPAVWAALPGRELLASGYPLLGMPLPWVPISFAPYNTLVTALTLLPPLALLVGMLRLRAWSTDSMLAAVVLGAAISIGLGVLQVSSGSDGSWYFYKRTNLGVAVGIFANGNHFATLLLASVPLLGALATARWRSSTRPPERSLVLAAAIAAAALLVIGILINQSTAMLLIGPPVGAATVLLVMRLSRRRLNQGLAVVGLLLVAATATVLVIGKQLPALGTAASIEKRSEYWSHSIAAIEDQPLTGWGFGSFQQAYRLFESRTPADRWYVNHAHNDYLEVALEGGVAAIVLMLVFLWWWAGRARQIWASPGELEQKGAVVASAAILLHSLFDYPLRTAAIAAVFAVCLALLAGARGIQRRSKADDAEPARHATL
jgi:O-antigen ligase